MTDELVIHGFETSNNMKVRVALGYKGIPYEFRSIDPGDRSTLARISGQFLTPVLQHGKVGLSDSAAILRYLEANFPDTPKLFGAGIAEQWAIEDWELFARTELAGPMMETVHTKVTGGTVDDAMAARCSTAFGTAADKLAHALKDRQWLIGDTMTAADITAGAVIHRIRVAEFFPFSPAATEMFPWVDRVMSFDGKHRKP
jgi:glutathione S-transferase